MAISKRFLLFIAFLRMRWPGLISRAFFHNAQVAPASLGIRPETAVPCENRTPARIIEHARPDLHFYIPQANFIHPL